MRIIAGKLKGKVFRAPDKLPVRPTTDMAKEALFNILQHQYDWEQVRILDLFSGTGSISLEFASRGIENITAVDKHPGCVHWLKSLAKQYEFPGLEVIRADVFKFIEKKSGPYQVIFADPPYNLPTIPLIPQLIIKNGLLAPNGTLIIEHPPMLRLDTVPGYAHSRKYGNSSFSFFENPDKTIAAEL